MMLNESRAGKKFGIGQNGNINLGVAAPLFLPNDLSIIQSNAPTSIGMFKRSSEITGNSSANAYGTDGTRSKFPNTDGERALG